MQRIGDVWLIGVASFLTGGDQDAKLSALISDIKAHIAELRQARYVVIDVRGNGGGNSAWGVLIAQALWGQQAVDRVVAGLETVEDWRATSLNIAALEADAADQDHAHLSQDAAGTRKLAIGLRTAMAGGKTFYRQPSDTSQAYATTGEAAPARFAHRIYYLTDSRCASACLDFSDIVLKMPNVIQIGQPTNADSTYMDIATAKLSAGGATLRYAMKVIRNRQRGSNVGYDPEVPWTGGVMTDASVAHWVDSLP